MVARITKEQFFKEMSELHPQYDFSKSDLINNTTKVLVTCPTHGEFYITPKSLRSGCRCKKCSVEVLSTRYTLSNSEFLGKLLETWGEKYDYSKVKYVGSTTKIIIGCKEHGEFLISPGNCLKPRPDHQVLCPKCNKQRVASSLRCTTEDIVRRSQVLYGDLFSYEHTSYINSWTPISVTCKKHGRIEVLPNNFLAGHGCRKCSDEARSNSSRKSIEEFIKESTEVHGFKYDYSKVKYINNNTPVEVKCKVPGHTVFWPRPNNHINSQSGCPTCSHTFSREEDELRRFIESLGITTKKTKLSSGKEIDIFCPDLNIGFEYNGLQWHSEDKRGKEYHLNKLIEAESENITLIQVFSDEWLSLKDIVKNRIKSILGVSTRSYARNLTLKKIPWAEASEFLEKTHLQGKGSPGSVCYALTANEVIVSIMTFSKLRFEKGISTEYELVRYCSTGTVVGGFSRLLKRFLSENECSKVVSYSDKRWSVGNVYSSQGFTKESTSEPGYFWCKGITRNNRMHFQKHKLSEKLQTFDPLLSESENCKANGYFKVYDCGMDKWVLSL